MVDSHWLICPNQTEVRRVIKNSDNKDKFNAYIYIDSGIVKGSYGHKAPLMKYRREEKIDVARKEQQNLINEGWQITDFKQQSK